MFAKEVLRVVPLPRVGYRARALYRLPARRRGAQRAVRLVIMIRAERLAIQHVERLVGERFLQGTLSRQYPNRRWKQGRTHMALMAIKALAVILAFKLAIRRGHRLLLNRQVTPPALQTEF